MSQGWLKNDHGQPNITFNTIVISFIVNDYVIMHCFGQSCYSLRIFVFHLLSIYVRTHIGIVVKFQATYPAETVKFVATPN